MKGMLITMKKMMISVLSAAVLTVNAAAVTLTHTRTYAPETFSDVPADAWYAENVADCYAFGILEGEAAGVFDPEGLVTNAEALTLACRVHARFCGNSIDTENADGAWYAPYEAYAAANGISSDKRDPDAASSRAHLVSLLFAAVPRDELAVLTDVSAVPDVSASSPYAEAVKAFYASGILTGGDANGSFYPASSVTRAETAAILDRVLIPAARKAASPAVVSADDAYLLAHYEEFTPTLADFEMDLRATPPKTATSLQFAGLPDVSESLGNTATRRFDPVFTGKVTLNTTLTQRGDGVYIAFGNADEEIVCRLEREDGAWRVTGADGSVPAAEDAKTYRVTLSLDIDNACALAVVDGVKVCETALDAASLKSGLAFLRYGTTEAGTPSFNPRSLEMTVNYPLYETFSHVADGMLPYGFRAVGATVRDGELVLSPDAFAEVPVTPVSGRTAAEFTVFLPEDGAFGYTLLSGGEPVIRLTADGERLLADGETVYDVTYTDMWYRVRLEADENARTLAVKLNGRVIAELPFEREGLSVDCVKLENAGAADVRFDDLKLFRLVDHEDYVPAPVKPAGEENYTVGINVCSLWTEGDHRGWAPISAYDDNIPVLGYYDEGVPETADWEIKYMVEHGIDFQAFCWFADSADAPLKAPAHARHLHDGFMNAKYADDMRYCLLYEAANGRNPAGLDAWKTYYVPYLIENYFKDARYMTVDNRPILAFFGMGDFVKALGGAKATSDAFAYLDAKVKELGFDGMLYLQGGSANKEYADMGFEGCFAYSWGTAGYSLETTKNNILASDARGFVRTIPTVSVGFNEVAWTGNRYPLMTAEDYRAAHAWVKDTILPSRTDDWSRNFVWLSTWNEYGEGTYVMPVTGERGFSYLDVLREAYTDEEASDAVNVVPTASQRRRINHLYPQSYHYLKKKTVDAPEKKVVYAVDLLKDTLDIWGVEGLERTADGITARSSGTDPLVMASSLRETVPASEVTEIRLVMKAPVGSTAQLFYKTSADNKFDEKKSKYFTAYADDYAEYIIKTDTLSSWDGDVTGIRIDPTDRAGQSFDVRALELLGETDARVLSTALVVNDRTVTLSFPSRLDDDGTVYAVFEPATAMDELLNAAYRWDKETGKLSLSLTGHAYAFTVGEARFLADGHEETLVRPVASLDGLPVIPLERICKENGYTVSVDDNKAVRIVTPEKDYEETVRASLDPDCFEFDIPGYVEGWTCSHMTLTADMGVLSCVSRTDHTDPNLFSAPVSIDTAKYNKFEIRVRYKYEAKRNDWMQLFFITDTDGKWGESKAINATLKSRDTGEEFEVYTVDLTKLDTWKDTVVRLRFDPFGAVGSMDIDYIRFVYDRSLDPENAKEDA